MGLAEEWMELAQASPVLVRDDRTGGASKTWLTDGLYRRQMLDEAEIQLWHQLLGLKQGYPPVSALPVASWTLLQRVPEAT